MTDFKRYNGQIVLVTGASRGIGRAIAEAYLREGARVALCARTLDNLEDIVAPWNRGGRQAVAIQCDVSSKVEVEAAMQTLGNTWGRLNILVNNAGISGLTPLAGKPNDELWDQILQTNLSSAYHVTRQALEYMESGGAIVNIASILGRYGIAGLGAYCASKHGLIGLTRAMAEELAATNITVNAICPGWVDTEMADQGIQAGADALDIDPTAFREQAIQSIPQKRFLDADEVAQLALFLTSREARGITGQAYNVSGGQRMD